MEEETEKAEEHTLVFGIPVLSIEEDIQPLECMILVKGINMKTGMPTMTTIGSEGITPWEAMGMMQMEIERIKMFALFESVHGDDEDEE